MNYLMRKIQWWLCLSAFLLIGTASAQNGTPRKYDPSGTIYLEQVYHVDLTKDKTLRALGYTEAMLPDSFPAFTEFWRMHGWPRGEMLDLYLFECAWNDVIYGTDGYYGKGFYIRGNYISQSRAHIVAPCGKFHIRFHPFTAIGMYTGGQAQVSSDATGTLLGGTAIEIDHFGWSPRATDRVCLQSTVWGKDYSQVGGIAYQEGVLVEYFRFMGARSQAGSFTGLSTGCTLNEPGEQSGLRYCMAENFTGAGYTIFNGTPFMVETCSAFNNTGPGFDLLGSNGLCNVRLETPSGDNNLALIRIRPKDAQSVGGGTITVTSLKSETRASESGNRPQIPILIEGNMGDLNLTVNGLTADYIGVACPYLIGGNWSGNQFEINARGIDLRSGVEALAYQGSTGKKLTGGKQYSGNSFVWNDEGLAFKSRANMTLSTGTVTPPSDTWTCPPTWSTCVNGSQSRTCTCTGTCAGGSTRVETQACTVTPPPSGNTISTSGWTVTASATNPGGREQPSYAIDADLATVWTSGIRQDASDQWIQFAAPAEQTFKAASFALPTAWSNDYARTAQVYVGSSATGGAAVSATITGTNPMTVTFASPVKGKYFRLTAKKTAGVSNWFTVGAATFTKP